MIEALELILFWMLVGLLIGVTILFLVCLVSAYDHQNDSRTYYFDKPEDPDPEALKLMPHHHMTRREYKELCKVHEIPRGYRWMKKF